MKARMMMWLTLVTVLAGCASSGPADLTGLAARPPLPVSVLVSGGTFLDDLVDGSIMTSSDGPRESLLATFRLAEPAAEPAAGPVEAIPLEAVVAALRRGRVFARLEIDAAATTAERFELAGARGNLPLRDPAVDALLTRARAAGHDYALVVQRLQDGPIEAYGTNDRWPLTLVTWLLVGLGLLVPDHTFESRATVQASLFEVYSGREVHRAVGSAGPTELSLIGRSSTWGLVQSIIVPPFWVSSADDEVVVEVRSQLQQRLPVALARRLKSPACQQDLAARARATFVAEPAEGGGVRIVVRSRDGLSLCALRIDGRVVDEALAERFRTELLGSVRPDAGQLLYSAVLGNPPAGRFLQVLVQSVRGDAASATIDLRNP